MDIAHLCIAILPLSTHLLTLSAFNLSRHPCVVSGSRNLWSLALAISGMMIVGPMDLFLPDDAVRRYGFLVWPIMIGLYVLCWIFVQLVSRPRLVIYGISLKDLRPVLERVVMGIDGETRWVGDCAELPNARVHFCCDEFSALRNVTLESVSDRQSHFGWRRLQSELRTAFRKVDVPLNRCGIAFLVVGMLLLAIPTTLAAMISRVVAQQFADLLRLF